MYVLKLKVSIIFNVAYCLNNRIISITFKIRSEYTLTLLFFFTSNDFIQLWKIKNKQTKNQN